MGINADADADTDADNKDADDNDDNDSGDELALPADTLAALQQVLGATVDVGSY